jgi:hypothetical protein
MESSSTLAVMTLITVHIGAIAAALGTRMAAGSRAERFLQLLFLTTMAAVGLCTWGFSSHELGLGIPSGLLLTATVIVAVTDFRRTHEPVQAGLLSLQR